MPTIPKRPTKQASLPTLVSELWQLIVAYLKQEALHPLKGLVRFVGFGLAGSLLLAFGIVMLGLAGLRALQAVTGDVFSDGWSWAPYFIVVIVLLALAGLSARAITKRKAV